MTLVMIWPDRRENPQTLTVASDSLLADPDNPSASESRWEYATKIIRLYPANEYVAYTGASLLALSAVTQSIALLQNSDLLSLHGTPETPQGIARCAALRNHLDESIKAFPKAWRAGSSGATLLHCGYDYRLGRCRILRIRLTDKGAEHDESSDELTFGAEPLLCFGSGASMCRQYIAKHGADHPYKALKHVILSTKEPSVGGPPQMVVLGKDAVQVVGFVWKQKPTLFGLPLRFRSQMRGVEFRTLQFQVTPYPLAAKVKRRS